MSQGLFTSLYEAGRPFALIDTRERRDHVDGHWFGSTNIPLSVLSARITRLIPDHSFPVHLLDWQDAGSDAAGWCLSRLGYTNVTRCPTSHPRQYGGGFVKGEYVWSKAFGEVLAHGCGLPEVTPAAYLEHHRDARLFDVRPTAEYNAFTIPGSQSLPNSLLLANLAALQDTGQMALLHCAGRTRSIIGACTLKAAGYQGPFAIFRGGTQAWQLDGLEREFDASRVFATETGDASATRAFLDSWNIAHEIVAHDGLEAVVTAHQGSLMFDVSDDSARGVMRRHGIIGVSGTNLIQQTDQSIARYHVPVLLFDHGSGSRAAFAAYWLRAMGFAVRVALLPDTAALQPVAAPRRDTPAATWTMVSLASLLARRDKADPIFDFRSSQDFRQAHVTGSVWRNISTILATDPVAGQPDRPVTIISRDQRHGCETADLLHRHGWQIAGVCAWRTHDIDPADLPAGDPGIAVDESALFAGRHHGNLQDSRDYLAWEEELPDQIDPPILRLWQRMLAP